MTFSVIIPVYNADKYLKDTMDSLLGQIPEGGDVEVLLMENGSGDNSPRICDEYATKHDFVKSFHLGPAGAYSARREGMKRAHGRWLLFVDADDELSAGAIKNLSEKVKSFADYDSAPDIILYDWEKLEKGKRTQRSFPFEEGKVYQGDDKEAFYDVMCKGDSLNALWNKCIKRTLAIRALESQGMGFLNHGEDLLQTAEFLDNAEAITYLKKVVYTYKSNEEGLSGSYHKEFLPNQISAWEKFEDYVRLWSRGTDRYKEMIDKRKSLTCTIAVKTLIYSGLKLADKKEKLTELMNSSFYKEYAMMQLPDWASEEDVFVHRLQTSDKAFNKLIGSGVKHDIKSYIKARIRN